MPPLKLNEFNENCLKNGNANVRKSSSTTDATITSVESKTTSPIYCNTQYPFKVLTNLNRLREQSRFCDVIIVAGECSYKAHRAVLSASSEYFAAMFSPELGLTEVTQRSVVMHTIDGEILRTLLDFIYTGHCEITQSNVQELLAAADMLQLHEAVEGCKEFLCSELHATNALGILRFAETHNCSSLAESALNFVHANFTAVTLEDEFLETPQPILSQILSSELLRVDSESQVFQAALRWIKHDVLQRRCHVFEVFSHVRLNLVPFKVMDKALKDCRDISIKVALRSMCRDIAAKRGQLVPLRKCPRQLAKKLIYVIGGSQREEELYPQATDSVLNTIARYDVFRREWSEVRSMKIARILPGVTALNGKIYVVGGELVSKILSSGEVYDPQNDEWSPISSMIATRCEFGLAAIGEKLYAIGGWVGDDIGDSMECYDPDQDRWQAIGKMPKPLFSMGAVSFEGLIYLLGGCTTEARHLPDFVSFNPVTNEWNELPPMLLPRCQMGVAVIDRYLYVVGGNGVGNEALTCVERYSFDKNRWESLTPMNVPRATPAVAAADGLIYVIGGNQRYVVNFYHAQKTIRNVECYDPLSDSWKACPHLPTGRSEAGAVVV